MDVGMIGLGRMGANLTGRLMDDGHRVVVHDVNSAAVEANRVRLATNSWPARSGDLAVARILWRWSRDREVDLRALAVQFCIREERIATTLVGPRSRSKIDEVIVSANTPIDQEHWDALEDLLDRFPAPSPGGEAAVGKHPPAD